jgi:hypothetical protein
MVSGGHYWHSGDEARFDAIKNLPHTTSKNPKIGYPFSEIFLRESKDDTEGIRPGTPYTVNRLVELSRRDRHSFAFLMPTSQSLETVTISALLTFATSSDLVL